MNFNGAVVNRLIDEEPEAAMAAFDALPAPLRRAIAEAPLRIACEAPSVQGLVRLCREFPADKVAEALAWWLETLGAENALACYGPDHPQALPPGGDA